MAYSPCYIFMVRHDAIFTFTRSANLWLQNWNLCERSVAVFYEEMTKVESLNPLRTLHNSIPLKEMDSFFDKTAGQATEDLVTPVSTPSRKPISKKLVGGARPSNDSKMMEKMNCVASENTESVTDLLSEAVQKLDS